MFVKGKSMAYFITWIVRCIQGRRIKQVTLSVVPSFKVLFDTGRAETGQNRPLTEVKCY